MTPRSCFAEIQTLYQIGPFELDSDAHVLTHDGAAVALGGRAVTVLSTLVGRANEFVSKSAILEAAWPGLVVEEGNLAVQISAVRRALARVPGGDGWIETLARRGYRFVGPVSMRERESKADSEMPATGGAKASGRFGNLPDVLPPLFGRNDDVAAVCALINAHRLVSVVGAGGIGKTRLAQAVAHLRRHDFTDGAWMVELASVMDSGLVPTAVAQTLGIKLSGKKDVQDEVLEALLERELLLVLDNCEHLVDAASKFVASMATQADRVRVLVTSQEVLKVPDEHVYRAATLAVPATATLGEAQQAGAVQLLVGRVRARQPTFALSEENVEDVVDICRRLDGLPLAIELAAARVPLLGTSGVRDRLHERFRILTDGARTALRRHQTLRETMAWSHGLLSEEERCVFRRAAVFAGGFTMAVAQAALVDDRLDEWAVLEQIGTLVDKSLLVAEWTEPPRYRLLESPRAYALEELERAGELAEMKDRHARAMLAWFEAGWDMAWITTREKRLERYMPDLDNLRAALDWVEQGEAEFHIALVGASGWIWPVADLKLEGWYRAEAARVRIGAGTPRAIEARLQVVCARTALRTQPGPDSLVAATRAAELYRLLGDRIGLYHSLVTLARAAALSSQVESAKRATDEMVALIEPTWPRVARWDWVVVRAFVLYVGSPDELDEVQSLVGEMSRLANDAGDADKILTSLMWQQLTANMRGDFAAAARLGREVVARARQNRFGSSDLTNALGNQTLALVLADEVDEAAAAAGEAAAMGLRGGMLWGMLDAFALLACKLGRFDDAAVTLGRAEAVSDRPGSHREPAEQLAHDQALHRLQEVLPPDVLHRLVNQGRLITDEEAARIALSG